MWRFVLLLCVCLVSGLSACDCGKGSLEPGVEDGGSEVSVAEKAPDIIPAPDVSCAPTTLLDHSLWKQVARADDPYKDLAPPDKPCDDVAYKLEDGVIEVETGICSFITVTQVLSTDVHKGQKFTLIFWHLALTAPSSGEGYFSIGLGQERIFIKKIPIPADPEVYEETITLTKSYPKGTPLYFHLHNHGANTWKLLSLDRVCAR